MKNILITGGAGFIGSHAAEFYANNNDVNKIILIDNISRSKLLDKIIINERYNWNYLKKYDKIEFYEKDIKDFEFLRRLLYDHEINVIIHTAAQTAVTTSVKNPIADFKNNLIGSFNLLEAVRQSKNDPVIIFCSTNKVFGNNVNKIQVTEDKKRYKFEDLYDNGISENFSIDLSEHTPYGTSKLCSDLYFQEYGYLYGLKTGIFRMSCIYGSRQFGVEDQGWVAHFIISALTGRKINIYGDGKQVRDILYISDLLYAYEAFIEKANKIKNAVFCMGGGPENTLSLLELIDILEDELSNKIDIEYYNWRPSDQKVYISNIDKANRILNWAPKVSPKIGVKKVIDWVKSHKNLFETV